MRLHRDGRRAPATAAAIVAVALLAAGFPTAAAEPRVHVQGRLVDQDGKGVSGASVRLIKTKREITLPKFTSGGQIAEAARVETDAGGFYEIDVPRDRSFDDYYLRFHDPATFDSVQYEMPPDREITRDLKRGETLHVDVTLVRRAEWTAVAGEIEAEGADSPKGKILRSMGLPERRMSGVGPEGPREEWWYHSRGVVYFFKDGKAAGYRKFDPVPLSSSSGAAGSPAAGGGA